MNMLVNPSNEVVTMVTNIYNNSGGGTPANTNTSAINSNAFGGIGNSGSGIFGAQQSAAVSSNPFASNAAGFGAQSNNGQSTQNSASLFGPSQAQTSSIFGGGGGTTSSASTGTAGIFGSSGFTNTPSNSLFGSTNQNKASIFGSSATTGAFGGTQTNTTSLFGAAQPALSIFGGNAQSNPVFGGPATFGSTPSASIFGQTNNTNLNQEANKGSLFGQSNMQSFGAVASQPQPSIFGGGPSIPTQQPIQSSIFGQQTTTAQNAGSIFGAPQTQQMPSTNIFGASSAPSNVFAAAEAPAAANQSSTASIFGGDQLLNVQQQQQSIFGAPANPTAQSQSIFGSSSFQQPQVQQQQQQQQSATLYSSIDSLTAEEIAAFNANTFELGKIPTKPPPRECCA